MISFSFFWSVAVKVDGLPEKCSIFHRMLVEETAHLIQVCSKLILPYFFLKCLRFGEIQKIVDMQHTVPRPCLPKGNIDCYEFEKGFSHNSTQMALVCYLSPGRAGLCH